MHVWTDVQRGPAADIHGPAVLGARTLAVGHVQRQGHVRRLGKCRHKGAFQPYLFLDGGNGNDVPAVRPALQIVERHRDGGHRGAVVKRFAGDPLVMQLAQRLAERDKISHGDELAQGAGRQANVHHQVLVAVGLAGAVGRPACDSAAPLPRRARSPRRAPPPAGRTPVRRSIPPTPVTRRKPLPSCSTMALTIRAISSIWAASSSRRRGAGPLPRLTATSCPPDRCGSRRPAASAASGFDPGSRVFKAQGPGASLNFRKS